MLLSLCASREHRAQAYRAGLSNAALSQACTARWHNSLALFQYLHRVKTHQYQLGDSLVSRLKINDENQRNASARYKCIAQHRRGARVAAPA